MSFHSAGCDNWRNDKLNDMAKLERNSEIAKENKENPCEDSLAKKLRKRNKYKWFGYHLATLLYYNNPNSSLRKSYENTFHCASQLQQHDKVLNAKWCKNRWCPACNRNKMGLMINTYGPRLNKEKNLWFLTLTRPNVPAEQLREELGKYQEIWRELSLKYWFKKFLKTGCIGIRKIECTYNPTRDDYHPHLHLLISDEEFAKKIFYEWIHYDHGVFVSADAQDLRPAQDAGGYLEIFKYFTKLIAKDGQKREFFDAIHMNIIFEAMAGRRVYFRIGSRSAWGCDEVTEEQEDEVAALQIEEDEDKIWTWMQRSNYFGYYNVESGEVLTEMKPTKHLKQILDNSENR